MLAQEARGRMVLDHRAANILLMQGSVQAMGIGDLRPTQFALPLSEYALLYARALSSRRFCPPRYHAIAMLLRKSCECRDGWVPLLSSSFIETLSTPALEILSQGPETITLRLGLRRSFPGLGERDASLLTAAVLTSSSNLVCSKMLGQAYLETASRLGVEVLELSHQDCLGFNGTDKPGPG